MARRGVNNYICCVNDDCARGEANNVCFQPGRPANARLYVEEKMVVVDHDVPYYPETVGDGRDPEAIRCDACREVMHVVPFAINEGRPSGSRSEIGGGVVVDSPDHSVCGAGRVAIGSAALATVRPGETAHVTGAGMGFAVKRTPRGDGVSVVRDDGLAQR